ncbi:MAG: diaminopimelate epimerase [Clostridia bacterium]|nr:diaminopimelate epimerase [Clostridia bacterium]
MHFTKMHGLGNDYLYVYGEVPSNIEELSKQLSKRHFGAGSDGMIYISPSAVADFKMRIFNADGSEAKMCGNGIRCVGKYVYDKGYTDKTRLTVETLSGIKTLELDVSLGKVESVSVDMGRAIPDGVNVEFVQVLGYGELRMRVWERGSGVTMACGTGACDSAMAAVKKTCCSEGEPILVYLDGGTLKITIAQDGNVRMTGPAAFVYEGETIN